MKYFNVIFSSNVCVEGSLDLEYKQGYQAWFNGKCWAEHNTPGSNNILEKLVLCESGSGAILKFIKWQNEGLGESFLIGETS